MNMLKTAALSFALVAGLSAGASAQDAAQESGAVDVSARSADASSYRASPQGRLRFHAGLHFGGGGGARFKADIPGGGEQEVTGDMKGLIGLHGGADYIVMDYFAIGGETRLTFPKADGAEDRSLFWDLNVKPRGRYQFGNIPLEVYGTLPMGLSVIKNPEVDAEVGFNLGFGPGATYFFNDKIGINSELLGVWHWFSVEQTDGFDTFDASVRVAQFYLMVGAVYSL